jgi:hypothetical protein
VGAIGEPQPRTAHSYIPEFEQEIGKDRLSVEEFATKLGDFFHRQWRSTMPPKTPPNDSMVFLVGGFDEDAAYGRVFEVVIPAAPIPAERNPDDFGITWGGQVEVVGRLLNGFDPNLDRLIRACRHLSQARAQTRWTPARRFLAVFS